MRTHWIFTAAVLVVILAVNLQAEELTNLAPQAQVSASSEYSGSYLARWAIDGKRD